MDHCLIFGDKCLKYRPISSPATNIAQKLDQEISNFILRSSLNKTFLSSEKEITYSEFLSNKMMMIFLIQEGVPYSMFSLIQHLTPFTDENWADYLEISSKSLQRYKQTERPFKSMLSEKIIEIAEVTNVGLDVFGDIEPLKRWLETPNFALGNFKPLELLKNSYGKELVLGELTRINYGILA